MSTAIDFGLIIFSISLLLMVMVATRFLARYFDLGSELQRKLVHIGTGLYTLTFPLFFNYEWQVPLLIVTAIVVMGILRLPPFGKARLGSVLHGVQRKSYGEIYLALAVGFLFFRSQNQLVLYVLPLLVITLSDTAAALVGTAYGKKHYVIEEGEKSLEGSLAFFVTTWLIAMITLLLLSDIGRLNIVLVSFMIGIFGTLVEADSWKGLDNLFVPLAIHLFLENQMNAAPLDLLLLMVVFAFSIGVILYLAPMLKLKRHAARGYVTLVFLILSVTAYFNSILPILTILAHIIARIKRPSNSEHPDLELLAAVSFVALGWLGLGEYNGQTAINLFNLSFAAATAIFLGLAFAQHKFYFSVVAGSGIFIALLAITQLNPVSAHWYGAMWPWAILAIASGLALSTTTPSLFDRQRSARVFSIAIILPVTILLTKGNLL